MAKVTISQAATLVGRSRQTIYDHIEQGKLSATTNAKGTKVVETSELARVYEEFDPPSSENGQVDTLLDTKSDKTGQNLTDNDTRIVAVLEEQVADLKNQLDMAHQRETQLIEKESKLLEMLATEQEKTRLLMLPASKEKKRFDWRSLLGMSST